MTPIRTQRLILRNWEERDRDLFHRINSDDRVMEFFPFRRNRAQSDEVMDWMQADIVRDGYGWTAVELLETGECAGFVGLNRSDIAPAAPAGALEIGWRLAPAYWGKGYVTEAASRLLDFAFGKLAEDRVISFAVTANAPSIAVMKRLGMMWKGEFDKAGIPDTHQHLRRHALYSISREAWTRRGTGSK